MANTYYRDHAPVTPSFDRPAGCPFDPSPELTALRAELPIARLAAPEGAPGVWLVTGYEEVRSILADRRFSSRYEAQYHPLMGAYMPPAPIGDLTGMDAPEHMRLRRMLTGRFTVRRMNQLTERVTEITRAQLDEMEKQGPPADLVQVFAHPVPAQMICELLGVPYDERADFMGFTRSLSDGDDPEAQLAAFARLGEYLRDLARAKRADPTDDLLSDLTASDLTEDELGGVAAFLLGAGLDTTANMLALGTFALLRNPAQLAALRDDPDLVGNAVEELLRYLSIATTGMRGVLEDVELGGAPLKAGDTVVIAVNAANRDPARFADPDVLDLRRPAAGHLAFGHGVHQCLGQQLARVEMRVAFPALLARFPSLRLAVPADEVPLRDPVKIYGVHSLPVTW
ncbi:cytochrome P450 [Microtetraspora sp. NBRC 13810]|uniref:cytochrome P450 n=1 Tax=Microtetraspora sp. NBRC 13810 TaxID=3030990 RepID=UPI0024A143EB|nr:cytochrome P450 [Microtetraspora sp. NBRC 13810]GLW11313.1 cytochrome P450 [Microtetraspora sp. NBRC 13810]